AAKPELVRRDGSGPLPCRRLAHDPARRIVPGGTQDSIGRLDIRVVMGTVRIRALLGQSQEAVTKGSPLDVLVLDGESANQQLVWVRSRRRRARVRRVVVSSRGMRSIERADIVERKETGRLILRGWPGEVDGNRTARQCGSNGPAEDQGSDTARAGAVSDVGILGVRVARAVRYRNIGSGWIDSNGHEDCFADGEGCGHAVAGYGTVVVGRDSNEVRGRRRVVQGEADAGAREVVARRIRCRRRYRIRAVAQRTPRRQAGVARPCYRLSPLLGAVSRCKREGGGLPGRAGPVEAVRAALQGEGGAVGVQANAAAVVGRRAGKGRGYGAGPIAAAVHRRRHRRGRRRLVQGEGDGSAR